MSSYQIHASPEEGVFIESKRKEAIYILGPMVMIVRLYVQSLLCQEWEISVHTHFNIYWMHFNIDFTGWSLLIKCKKQTFYDVDILCLMH